MGNDFWNELDKRTNPQNLSTNNKGKRDQTKFNKEQAYKETEELQNSYNKKYSSNNYNTSYQAYDGDGASLYEKFSSKNGNHYKDEIANHYGAHNDGYSGNTSKYSLSRGLGAGPTQKIHLNNGTNNHRFDSSAPRIHIRLENTWSNQSQEPSQQSQPTQRSYNLSSRATRAGRITGGSKLNRF